MIVDLPATSTIAVSKRLVRLREEVGAMALTRVLTLVVLDSEEHIEDAVATTLDASRQNPCRVIAIASGTRRGRSRLDAQIRLGGDAGASEVLILRLFGPLAGHAESVVTPLLLADSPIVVWWPGPAPRSPAHEPVGTMATRRVTDSAATAGPPGKVLRRLARGYQPGDTDLAWSRVTLWRGLLAAALDEGPLDPVTDVMVTGAANSPSAELLAGWLGVRLGVPVTMEQVPDGSGIVGVTLLRPSGPVVLRRPGRAPTASLSQPGQPERLLALPRRSDAECLADELRRLDPDEVYAAALRARVHPPRI
ncbi:MAG: glucose-6-phosphate dehydrogenase assembly protein OpcA [Nostocoides sp.]